MSTIVTRAGKGSPLTNTEMDSNLTNLNTDKFEIGGTYSGGTINAIPYLNGSKVLTTGSALTFDSANLTILGNNTGTDYNNGSLKIGDYAVGGTAITIGNNAASNYSYVQAVKVGNQYNSIVLNPNGGNLGLGVTPSASWSGTYAKAIQLGNKGVSVSGFTSSLSVTPYANFTNNAYYASDANWKYYNGSYGVALYQQAGNQHQWSVAGTGTTDATISFTQAMTLDASSNLTVGSGTTNTLTLTGSAYGMLTTTNDLYVQAGGTGSQLIFRRGSTENGRFDGSGNLLVGVTADTMPNAGMALQPAQGNMKFRCGNANTFTQFYNQSNTKVGSIETNGTTTSYVTSSDYRLKNTIEPMTGALAKIVTLKPCTYKWNADGSDGEGFIAHELAEVVPQCVTGEKDAVEIYTDEEGNEQTRPKYQGIDTSFLVATLTAAIQEQQAIITQLQADVAALKG